MGALYSGAISTVHAASGDGPVAGAIVDEFDMLYGAIDDVIITTACLQGNPFVPSQPPPGLDATLSGCKLDIPGGTTNLADTAQLITVLPNNFKGGDDVLTNVYTYGTGSTTALETGVTVDAVSKDIFLGLANPSLFDSNADPSSDVQTTADGFCTSVSGSFACVLVEPGPAGPNTSCPSGGNLVTVLSNQTAFCSSLTGVLQNAYNLERNPLAYAISTNMSSLAQPGSVTLRLCPGFRAQCLPPGASPVASNVRVTTMHTQAAFVETPRLRLPYY